MYEDKSIRKRDDKLRKTITELERLLHQLRAFGFRHEATLDVRIMTVLNDCGPLSTNAIRSLLRAGRASVVATVRLLEAAGKIKRNASGKQWELISCCGLARMNTLHSLM
jgi:hypothetical protein